MKLAMLAFLYWREFVKNSIQVIRFDRLSINIYLKELDKHNNQYFCDWNK